MAYVRKIYNYVSVTRPQILSSRAKLGKLAAHYILPSALFGPVTTSGSNGLAKLPSTVAGVLHFIEFMYIDCAPLAMICVLIVLSRSFLILSISLVTYNASKRESDVFDIRDMLIS